MTGLTIDNSGCVQDGFVDRLRTPDEFCAMFERE